jgi:uncharacterized protein YqjF (DUF2071 family)
MFGLDAVTAAALMDQIDGIAQGRHDLTFPHRPVDPVRMTPPMRHDVRSDGHDGEGWIGLAPFTTTDGSA